MRLLFVSHSFPPAHQPLANVGGMQRVALDLASALQGNAETQTEVIALRSAWLGHHLLVACWLPVTLLRIMTKSLRGTVDAVLFSSMVTGSMALLLRPILSRLGIPMAAIAHGRDVTLPGAYQRFLVRHVLRALDAVLPVSRATASECAARGMPKARVRVIPNGVDTRRFRINGASGEAGSSFLLSSVGRLVERKGFAWFIGHVMPLLPECVHYHIAGSGPERNVITEMISRCDQGHRVKLLGRLPDAAICSLYHRTDLMIMPNIAVPGDLEGFGVVMLEAAASGTPVVAANLEGIQDVVTEGINGHLVTSMDASAFAETILTYVKDRPSLGELGTLAAAHTAATFSWERIAALYASTMRQLMPPARR